MIGRLRSGGREQLMLFGVMLMTAIGTAGMQSILPGLGRSLKLPDQLIGLSFALSALIFAVAAPFWGRRVPRYGAKAMIILGLSGFTISMVLSGTSLAFGLVGILSGGVAFGFFILARGVYGALGAAAQPAAQAMVAASTSREERTNALTLLASAFGLGTILGPALAPFFIMPLIGLAGPPFAFAALGAIVLVGVILYLPRQLAPLPSPLPQTSEPGVGAEPTESEVAAAADAHPSTGNVRFTDRRILPWLVAGIIGGHAQAISGQTMAFLIIDRLRLAPAEAQPIIGLVLMAGACAALLAQWGVIPRLKLQPRQMVLWGASLGALGTFCVALAQDLHTLAVTFAISALGFGMLRPGYTSGASLAVGEIEQGMVAGRVASTNGLVFVIGPSVGIFLYGIWRPLPYYFCAASLLVLIVYASRGLSVSAGAIQPD